MSDIMRPMPFAHLMNWILSEYRAQGSVFGVSKLVRHADGKSLPIFEEKIESPYGPAAGPHTQLAQNIIAAYAAGSRFFEVKTVQVMDGEELSKCVSKPCITAADECYNCEWSTELYVPQAFAEYVKAWFACKLLAKELELGDPDGFVFNMSVGYDLKGIQSPKVDAYIEGMKDASGTEVWRECMDWALANLDRFEKVDEAYVRGITPHVSNSITESTLHGCPPDEIERIATYLITEKNLNTYVKCNPTLLGYEFARKTLDGLGYDYIQFDDHHFREDLQWEDAVPMFHRLMQRTGERGVVLVGGDADGHLLLLLLLRRVGQVVGGGKACSGDSYQGYDDRVFVVYGDGPGLVADIADFEFTAFGDRYHGPAVFAGDGAFWGAGRLYERSFDGVFVFFIHYR